MVMKKVEQWHAGSCYLHSVSCDRRLRGDNCFIKGVIAITSLILHEQSTFLPFVSHVTWLEADKVNYSSLLSSS